MRHLGYVLACYALALLVFAIEPWLAARRHRAALQALDAAAEEGDSA
mgnify:CR=1 FL=1